MTGSPTAFPRHGFAEAMHISQLPDQPGRAKDGVKRYMSHRPAWKPGGELPWSSLKEPAKSRVGSMKIWAYGGHVYAQAPLAAARAVEEEDGGEGTVSRGKGKLGIHSIQGVFTNRGLVDRPFIYEVANISSGRSFSTRLVQVRQPTEASTPSSGPFPPSDANKPLGEVCFTCLTTFKRSMPSAADLQIPESAQERFSDILSRKAADEWEPSPQLDIDAVKALFPNARHGGFPILDMYKVDMASYNSDKTTAEKRELILYRPHKPIPEDDVNAHIVTHAFEADRNGGIMLANLLGWGHNLGLAASLSYSFYVHVNAEEAVMKGDGWWIQEVCWPRLSAGRGMMESRIWSPEGKHVASGYQDVIVVPGTKRTDEKL